MMEQVKEKIYIFGWLVVLIRCDLQNLMTHGICNGQFPLKVNFPWKST